MTLVTSHEIGECRDAPGRPGLRPGLQGEPHPCEFHSSDGWAVVDALVAIFTGVATILLVVLRHPFKIVAFAILLAVVGTIAGWWVP